MLECLLLLIALPLALVVGYVVLFQWRCSNCGRFFGRQAGRARIHQLCWYEQRTDVRHYADYAAAVNVIYTAVYVMVAQWKQCRHCRDVTVVALPERVRTYQDFYWNAETRVRELASAGIASSPPSPGDVNFHLDRIRNRLQQQ